MALSAGIAAATVETVELGATGLTSATVLAGGDVGLAISHSGRTPETVQMLAEAAGTTIALTNFPRSPLARLADLVLTTAVYETTFRPGSIAARHSQPVAGHRIRNARSIRRRR